MIENRLEHTEDVELLILWMQSPPNRKPPIPFDAENYLQRLHTADTWLRTYMSSWKVVGMLMSHYRSLGTPYSEKTARRDVEAAQRLFETMSSHKRKYWTDIQLDLLAEQQDSAKRAGKHEAVAKLSREFRAWMQYNDECEAKEGQLTPLVDVHAVYDPALLGMTVNPYALQEAEQLLIERKLMPARLVTDAEIITDDASPDPAP